MQHHHFNRITKIGLLSLIVIGITACSDNEEKSQEQGQKVGMANPAAVFCEKHGEYDLESGQCKLKSGDVVDAWEYYRQQNKE